MNTRITTIPHLRKSNELSLIRIIWKKRLVTRKDLSQLTTLTPTTISSITNELIERELIRIHGKENSTGGRQFNPESYYALGFRFGVYESKGIITDLFGNTVREKVIPADYGTENSMLRQIHSALDALLSGFKYPEKILGIGISIPASVDHTSGVILHSSIIGEHTGCNVKEYVETKFGFSTFVENNANLCALHESLLGRGVGKRIVLFIFAGYGIGNGLTIDGNIFTGATDASGNIGHTVVDVNGKKCYCGSYGCLETIASYPALFQYFQTRVRLGTSTVYDGILEESFSPRNVEKIFALAATGDKLSIEAIEHIGSYLGVGVANLIGILNPDRIILRCRCRKSHRYSESRYRHTRRRLLSCTKYSGKTGETCSCCMCMEPCEKH